MKSVKVFVASPSDVLEERQIAFKLIERLGKQYSDRANIVPLLWEHEPLLASSDFQSQIGSPADADIFLMIMHQRIGSPLSDRFKREDGSQYKSATEYEFETALDSYQSRGSPSVLVYRKFVSDHKAKTNPGSQTADVQRFFDRWFLNSEDDSAAAAYHSFNSLSRFEDLLEMHLRKLLRDALPNPSNLPLSLTPIIGREELLARIIGLQIAEDVRLVTLIGAGGIGKTRLAIEVGKTVLSSFKDGVFFVPLAPVTHPDLVPTAISNALGVTATAKANVDKTIEQLKRKQALLVIDNLEHVQAASSYLAKLLAECPDLKILVTGRQILRIKGARTVEVPPLDMPPDLSTTSVAELLKAAAINFFVMRAKMASQNFELTEENASDVMEICRRIDAIPLAIELAASRIRTMSPAHLVKALDQRFRVLQGGDEDLLDHQKSLYTLIEWSYDLLDESDRRLWRRLSVFRGGCDSEDAQLVCDPDDEYIVDVDIERLADRSLVQIDTSTGSSRITMLESLRQYAFERLSTSDESDRIHKRFREWCLELTSTLRAESDDVIKLARTDKEINNLLSKLARIDREIDNLRFALQSSLRGGDNITALQLSGDCLLFWETRGLTKEGIEWLRRALALDTKTAPIATSRALFAYATLMRNQLELESALESSSRALEITQTLGDHEEEAKILGLLGCIHIWKGDLNSATKYLEQCIVIRRDDWVLGSLGVLEHVKGDLAMARSYYGEALEFARSYGHSRHENSLLVNLGEIAETEGRISEAHKVYVEAMRNSSSLEDLPRIAYIAELLAGIESYSGDAAEAAFLFGAAERIREEDGTPIDPTNQGRLEKNIEQARAALSDEEFTLSWQTGRALGADGVIRHVLG